MARIIAPSSGHLSFCVRLQSGTALAARDLVRLKAGTQMTNIVARGVFPMSKFMAGLVFGMLASMASLAAELTPTETRWLKGAWPVVTFAREARLPLDIVVQPQATPGAAPLALAFVDGRCKLVLSMRGNPEAETALDGIAPELRDAALELMAAHELGHCRRYLDGAWYGLPAGFSTDVPDALSPELRVAYADMQAARREEGYGDLVGLAWTRQQHPQHYERLYRWLVEERSRDRVRGSPHDTLAWVNLAKDSAALQDGSIFVAASLLWTRGLVADD